MVTVRAKRFDFSRQIWKRDAVRFPACRSTSKPTMRKFTFPLIALFLLLFITLLSLAPIQTNEARRQPDASVGAADATRQPGSKTAASPGTTGSVDARGPGTGASSGQPTSVAGTPSSP